MEIIISIIVAVLVFVVVGLLWQNRNKKQKNQENIQKNQEIDSRASTTASYNNNNNSSISEILSELREIKSSQTVFYNELEKLKKEQIQENYKTVNQNNTDNKQNYITEENNIKNIKKTDVYNENNVTNIQNYNYTANLTALLAFLNRNLEEHGKKDALQLHDKIQIEIKKKEIYQETISFITQVKNYYKKQIESHDYHINYHYRLGTEDSALYIDSNKKQFLEELAEVEKIENEIKDDTNHIYKKLILSYEKGFKQAASTFSMLNLGISNINDENNNKK